MAPLLQALLPWLVSLLPSPAEAVKIITDPDTRRDNLGTKTTKAAAVGAIASGYMVFDPDTPLEVVIATVLVSVALYFYRRRAG